MKTGTVLGIAAALLLAGGGVAFGMWLKKPTIEDLAERNRALAIQDSLRKIELEDGRTAYAILVRDYANDEETWMFVNDSMGAVANALKEQAVSDGREIESLTEANAQLTVQLEAAITNIEVSDDAVSAELFTYKSYQDGSIGVEGYVTIFTPEDDEPWGDASLSFDIQMQPSVLISRDETGLATCDVSFGDMPVYLTDLNCVDNLGYEPPIRDSLIPGIPNIVTGAGIITLGALFVAAIL
jgi:hypothetical protein